MGIPHRRLGGSTASTPGTEVSPLKGFTGYDGRWPTDEDMSGWLSTKPLDSNLMLRLDHGLVAIDVDAYEGKTGGHTLKEAESLWGELPRTYRSNARSADSVSGQRIFCVPAGVLFKDRIKFADLNIGGIEIVQPHHRYITAWPSIHPKTQERYRWYALDGSLMPEGEVPFVNDVPE
jgi:hypothetical protein